MAGEEENKDTCECKCTGWKVGFWLCFISCIILFIIILIMFIKNKKFAEKSEQIKDKGKEKLINWLSKKKTNKIQPNENTSTIEETPIIENKQIVEQPPIESSTLNLDAVESIKDSIEQNTNDINELKNNVNELTNQFNSLNN